MHGTLSWEWRTGRLCGCRRLSVYRPWPLVIAWRLGAAAPARHHPGRIRPRNRVSLAREESHIQNLEHGFCWVCIAFAPSWGRKILSRGPSAQGFVWTYVCVSLTWEKSVPRIGSADSSGDSAVKVFTTFYGPASNVWGFRFRHTLATLKIVCLISLFYLLSLFLCIFLEPSWWVWNSISLCFWFPWWLAMLGIFCALHVFCAERSLQVHCPFPKLSCLILSPLYSLVLNPLSPSSWFASIFSHWVVFRFLDSGLWSSRVFNFNEVLMHLSFFCCLSFCSLI